MLRRAKKKNFSVNNERCCKSSAITECLQLSLSKALEQFIILFVFTQSPHHFHLFKVTYSLSFTLEWFLVNFLFPDGGRPRDFFNFFWWFEDEKNFSFWLFIFKYISKEMFVNRFNGQYEILREELSLNAWSSFHVFLVNAM